MPSFPRVVSLACAVPPFVYSQDDALRIVREQSLGANWRDQPASLGEGKRIERLFAASGVRRRHSVVDLAAYYARRRSTGERMAEYQASAYRLGHQALAATLEQAQARGEVQSGVQSDAVVSDLIVVSCTGYSAPGLDVQLARDLGLPRDTRRTVVGHMGCFGALAGLRQGLAAVRAYPGATAALLSVELSTLHFAPTHDAEALTSFALFGDAAAALVLRDDPAGAGPEVVETYCTADFESADQMSWTIGDEGFVMHLSPRVPVTLRRAVSDAVARLLAPRHLAPGDIAHWLIHPGGPSILEAIQRRLELSDAQMAPSWQVLREYGNCSSATVLLILDALLASGAARRGEWGVMMAFGPGLTLETCLLRF